jgi:Toastrack DUF4097
MQISRRLLTLAFVLVLPLAAACDLIGAGFQEKATDEWTRTYPIAAGGKVEVVNVNGKIDLEGTDANQVEVRAERTGRGSTQEAAREMLKRIDIREDVTPTSVRLETKLQQASGFLHMGGGEVEYHVKVPVGAEVRLETVNGGIEVRNMKGRAQVETTNGGIKARGLMGPVKASTVNGGIDLDVDSIAASGIEVDCTNGGIKLSLPRNAKATVNARVVNGGIHVADLPIETTGESSRRRLDASLNGGGPRIQIEGTNGGITLTGK